MNNIPNLFSLNGEWDENRRSEIKNLFKDVVFGDFPDDNYTTSFKTLSSVKLDGIGQKEILEVCINLNGEVYKFPLYFYLPSSANEDKKVPLIIYICYLPKEDRTMTLSPTLPQDVIDSLKVEADKRKQEEGENPESSQDRLSCDLDNALDLEDWPVEKLLKNGYATASFYVDDLEPDYITDLKKGIIDFFARNTGKENTWRAIGAWSFGVSRVLDVLVEDTRIDNENIALVGHSRGGKTALWAAANDTRITCCYANNSGCTGAAISRGKSGEKLMHINALFPYWFCEKYKEFNKGEYELPIDQHMLLALVAPRKLYLASATLDSWADPKAEYLGALLASPAWEKYGLEGVYGTELPKVGVPSHQGCIGYHLRKGNHDITSYDWELFCKFWEEKRSIRDLK